MLILPDTDGIHVDMDHLKHGEVKCADKPPNVGNEPSGWPCLVLELLCETPSIELLFSARHPYI